MIVTFLMRVSMLRTSICAVTRILRMLTIDLDRAA